MPEAQNKTSSRKRIGDLLLKAGVIKAEHLPHGLAEADKFQLRLGEMLVMLRFMSTEDLTNVLQAQAMLDAGTLDEDTAVAALRQASIDKLDLEDAMDRVKELERDSLDSKKKLITKISEQIAEKEKILGPNNRELVALFLDLGDAHLELAQPSEAEKAFKKALQIGESSFGKNNLKVSTSLFRLTELYLKQNKVLDAEPLGWRLVQIVQEALGAEHLETGLAFQRMARILEASGRFVEAEQFYLSALRIKEKKLGPDHPDLVDQLRQMANFWSKQGRKSEKKRIGDILCDAGLLTTAQLNEAAQQAQKQGLPLGQYLLSLDSLNPDVVRAGLQAQLLIGDGVVPYELGIKAIRICAKKNIPLDESLEFIGWRADSLSTRELKALVGEADQLITAERTLGANHCGVAIICMRLGDNYLDQKRFSEAEANYKRALGILEKFFGPKDAEVATCLYKMAELFFKQQKYAEAESYIWRTLEIQQQALGSDHVDVATTLELLADWKTKQSNPEQAEMFYKTSLGIMEKLYGAESPKLVSILEKSADNFANQGKSEESVELYVRVAKIRQKRGDKQPLEVALVLDKLGRLYLKKGETASAVEQFEIALEVLESHHGQVHGDVAGALERLVGALRKTGNVANESKANELEARAKQIRTHLASAPKTEGTGS